MDARVMSTYSERERLSMALWDTLCDMLPATEEERALSRELDEYARRDSGIAPTPKRSPEALARQREAQRQWRATHKEYIAEQKRKNRAEVNDNQRGYKAARRMGASV